MMHLISPSFDCDMFTSVTDPRHKTQIIDLFTRESNLRVVIGTIAFGIGIDCPDVRQIVYIGLPDDAEGYIQETGRAGRDEQTALVTLLASATHHPVEQHVEDYVANTDECRRDFLFNDMDNYEHSDMGSKCLCCDVCAKSCSCGECESKLSSFVMMLQSLLFNPCDQ